MTIADHERGRLAQTISHLDRGDIDHDTAAWHLRRQVDRLHDELARHDARRAVEHMTKRVRELCDTLEDDQ